MPSGGKLLNSSHWSYLQNSSEEIELADILNWLSMYSNVEIKIEKKEKSDE